MLLCLHNGVHWCPMPMPAAKSCGEAQLVADAALVAQSDEGQRTSNALDTTTSLSRGGATTILGILDQSVVTRCFESLYLCVGAKSRILPGNHGAKAGTSLFTPHERIHQPWLFQAQLYLQVANPRGLRHSR